MRGIRGRRLECAGDCNALSAGVDQDVFVCSVTRE